MERMANIPLGTKGEEKLLVTSEVAIDFLGVESARVLATPHLDRAPGNDRAQFH